MKKVDISSIMPLIRDKVHTLDTQYHCMKIIAETIKVINPDQTPIDICDQPVFALTKQIRWKFPSLFNIQKYFSFFGDLHVEKSLLVIHGEFIKGIGLAEILGTCNLSVIGAQNTLVNANDIKGARYAMQVSMCAVFAKLKEGYKGSDSTKPIWEWLNEKSENINCLYWKKVLELEIHILIFIRSLRESNFQLHLAVLRYLLA